MKRDLNLIREMLQTVAQSQHSLDESVFYANTDERQKVLYNICLMQEAGLIDADILKDMSGDILSAEIKSLTWKGNEFLSAITDDTVWKKVKKKVATIAKDVPLEVIASLGTKMIVTALGLD